ncbi:hypothetical protein BC830DRAFT_1094943 [Chytriomyces sp. MP71]|nr:hypothetical protein BC830DRAFT_1094943 [Chytriomyces sp. MP71]
MDSSKFYSFSLDIVEVPILLLYSVIFIANIRQLRRLSPSSFLIFFLCLGDAIHSINEFIISLTLVLTGANDYNKQACQFQAAIITFGVIFSFCQGTGLTLIRYLAIVHNMKVRPHYAPTFTGASAAISAAVATLPFVLKSQDATYGLHPARTVCTVMWWQTDSETRLVSLICGFVLAINVCFMGFAYPAIYFRASKALNEAKESTLDSTMPSVEGGSQTDLSQTNLQPISKSKNNLQQTVKGSSILADKNLTAPSKKLPVQTTLGNQVREYEQKQKHLLMQSVAIVSAMLVGWGVYFGMAFIELFSGQPARVEVEMVADALVVANELLNPILVLIFDLEIRAPDSTS